MTLPRADHELTDDEITERFGDLLAEALAAFRVDASYCVEMVETASAHVAKVAHLQKKPSLPPGHGDKHDERLRELAVTLSTRKGIAEALGVSPDWVRRRMRHLGLELQRPTPKDPKSRALSSQFYADKFDARLRELAGTSATRRAIADELGVSNNWVSERLQILEIEKAPVETAQAVGDKYDDLITRMRNDGATLEVIAAEVGLSLGWVGRRLQRLKVPDPRRTRPSTELELHQMSALRRKGWSYNKLGEKFNIPAATIRSRLLKFEASRSRN